MIAMLSKNDSMCSFILIISTNIFIRKFIYIKKSNGEILLPNGSAFLDFDHQLLIIDLINSNILIIFQL